MGGISNKTERYIDVITGWMIYERVEFHLSDKDFVSESRLKNTTAPANEWNPNWWNK